MDIVQTHSLISLVNDNHVDNYLKEILAFVYYGSIINIRPKNVNVKIMNVYELLHEIVSSGHMQTAKTQTSLCINADWSGTLLYVVI